MSALVQLFEVVAEAKGGITEAEIRQHFDVVSDWADRPCLTVSDAAKARAMGLRQFEQEQWDGG